MKYGKTQKYFFFEPRSCRSVDRLIHVPYDHGHTITIHMTRLIERVDMVLV